MLFYEFVGFDVLELWMCLCFVLLVWEVGMFYEIGYLVDWVFGDDNLYVGVLMEFFELELVGDVLCDGYWYGVDLGFDRWFYWGVWGGIVVVDVKCDGYVVFY